ncbi:MAG TPA: hypothetical protein VLT61_12495 [Anaeromyxobacteraceae bacterium]|nr:hypothetical protein [Anaeromyxobacteraceae bacterium]
MRNGRGEELVVPSLTDLHDLYVHGFIEDTDLVRTDNSDRWVMAGRMPALGGVRLRRREPGKLVTLLVAAIAFVAIAVGAVNRLSPIALILAAIVFAVGIATLALRR